MRYAFMSFSTPTLSLEEMFDLAVELGYVGVEPRTSIKHAHGIEPEASSASRQAARELAARKGVAIACIAVSCKYADPAEAAKQVEATHAAIDLAGDVGCDRLRVFGGTLPEGVTRADAHASVVASLKSVADHAAGRGVTLCVETHDDWCNPAEVAAAMRDINHPAIAVNWDIMHTQRAGGASMAEAYALLRPWVRHVHVHDGVDADGKLQLRPIGEGDYDHAAALRLLADDDYAGYVSGEWIESLMSDDFKANHLERELAALRACELAAR